MRKVNKILMVVVMLAITIPALGAMSTSKVRQNTRFLTDRMAYELNLTQDQYDDIYEVNYDFINNVRYIMSDVARGDYYAVDRYYDFLDVRNDDLRWILSSSQYARFMDIDYFYRPIYTQNRRWAFRIYNVYTNVNFFYFGRPYHYSSYCGGHYRTHYNNVSFYRGRWNSRYNFRDSYHSYRGIRDDRRFDNHRRNDFGVIARPNNNRRPDNNYRPDNNRRPDNNYRPDNNRRPDNNYRPDNNRRPDNNNNARPENNRRPDNNNNARPDNNRRPDNNSRPERVENKRNDRVSSSRRENVKESSRGNSNSNNKRSDNNNNGGGARRR